MFWYYVVQIIIIKLVFQGDSVKNRKLEKNNWEVKKNVLNMGVYEVVNI